MPVYTMFVIGLGCLLCLARVGEAERYQFSGTEARAELSAVLVAGEADGLSPIEVTLNIKGFEFERPDEGFGSLAIKGLVPLGEIGAPEVYTTGVLFAVPEGYESEVSVLFEDRGFVEGMIKPAQTKIRCECENREFAFRGQLYRSDSKFPAAPYEITEIGNLSGLRLMRLGIHPFQMDFEKRGFEFVSQMRLRIDFRQVSRSRRVQVSHSVHRFILDATVNGKALGSYVRQSVQKERLLIVVADAYKSIIEPLVQWKRSKGIEVDVIGRSEAGSSKEQIKQTLQSRFDNSSQRFDYLIFVGNKDSMPTYMEKTTTGGGTQYAASDYPYALLAGGDKIPDVLYGRIVANDQSEVQTQMNRWITYEKEGQGSWYASGITIASNEGSGPSDKEYAQQMAAGLKAGTYRKIDAFVQGQNATANNIMSSLNEGRSWISYIGHGPTWPSTNGGFSGSKITQLKNHGKLPVIIDVACANATWATKNEPFAKSWVVQENGGSPTGAVVFYGGSVNISWDPPAIMAVGASKHHFEKPAPSLGETVLAGQMHLIEKLGLNAQSEDNLKWYNLLGDPSLFIRTDTPARYETKVKLFPMGTTTAVQVTIEGTSDELRPKELMVAVSGEQELFAVSKVSGRGQATLIVQTADLLVGAWVTVSGYNVRTDRVKVDL